MGDDTEQDGPAREHYRVVAGRLLAEDEDHTRVRFRTPSPRMRAAASVVLSYRIERGTLPKNPKEDPKAVLCPSQTLRRSPPNRKSPGGLGDATGSYDAALANEGGDRGSQGLRAVGWLRQMKPRSVSRPHPVMAQLRIDGNSVRSLVMRPRSSRPKKLCVNTSTINRLGEGAAGIGKARQLVG
jgi:hypothetical protein